MDDTLYAPSPRGVEHSGKRINGYIYIYIYISGGGHGMIVIIVGNRLGDISSNPG